MALTWKLLNFMDGTVVRSEGLPVSKDSADVVIDIHGADTAELDIIRTELTSSENNDWKTTFALLLRGVALVDDSKAWNEPGAILFSGFINKINDDINPKTIKAQITGLTEYTKGRIVADVWAPVSDPTTTVDFTGADWSEVLASVITKCFSADGIPAGSPKPYQVLGNIISSTGTTVKKSVKITDAKTYNDVMTAIGTTDAGNGLEWRFVPRWSDATMTKVVFDVIIGTTSVPHIKEDESLSLELSENNAKFSTYTGTFDSTDLYSKLYIQSTAGDDTKKSGADFSVATVPDSEFPVLFERFFNPGVALTADELNAQLSARLSFAAKSKYETSFSVEEKLDPSEWTAHLGKKLTLTGVADTASAGHDAVVRIVGITFTPGKGTVKAQLMQLGPTYPRLPKDRIQNLSGAYNGNSMPVPSTPSVGGGVPVVSTTPTGVGISGVPSLGNAWGDQGRNPWDGKPDSITNPDLSDYKDITYTFTNYLGDTAFHPYSTCQNDGNRIYGLDHVAQVAGTTYTGTTPTHYAGGVDWQTGAPLGGWKPFYVKMTYIVNGELGPITEVGTITSDQVKGMVAPYNGHPAYSTQDSNYETSILSANWIVDGRFYFALATIYRTKIGAGAWQEGTTPSNFYYNSGVSIISSNITAEGNLLGDWRKEKSDFPNFGFPMTPFIQKAGKVVAFTQFYQCTRKEFIDTSYNAWSSWQNSVYSSTGGWAPLDTDFWYITFGDAEMWGNKPGAVPQEQNIPGEDWGLGSLWKDYSTIDSAFMPYEGFATSGKNKRASGGVAHMAFSSNGSLYGINRYTTGDVKKISISDSGVATGSWQTVLNIPIDSGGQFSNLAIAKGCGYFADGQGNNTTNARLFPLTGGTPKKITTAPYISFPFSYNTGQIASFNVFTGDRNHFNGLQMSSKIFSYDARLYTFQLKADANGLKNTINLHSMQVVPAAA